MTYLTTDEIAAYYDEFGKRMVGDYVYSNNRVTRAIERIAEFVSPNTRRLLDVGCGIGISSAELARRHPQVEILAVDISPQNVRVAKSLFDRPHLSFEVSTLVDGTVQGVFDLIALVDVYEHIPRDTRPSFHKELGRLLSVNGTVVVTVPSPLLQRHMTEHEPAKLQIVDEVVDDACARQLACDLRAVILTFVYVSINRTNDYLHIVLQRNPPYDFITPARKSGLHRLARRALSFVGRWQRRRHVRRTLGIDVPLFRQPR